VLTASSETVIIDDIVPMRLGFNMGILTTLIATKSVRGARAPGCFLLCLCEEKHPLRNYEPF